VILRLDRIPIELPEPKRSLAELGRRDSRVAGWALRRDVDAHELHLSVVQFPRPQQARPYYDLIANIAAEEYSHIELVSYTTNMLLSGSTKRGTDPTETPLGSATDARNSYHFLASGQSALPVDSMGNPWTGQNVFSSGSLKLDLRHNFFLECGARANKIRVYEMVDDPTARTMIGYLLVRGGTHVVAYARTLEHLTGADLGKLFPIPDISNKQFPEARKLEEQGLHQVMFRFSPNDYRRMAEVWNGPHPEDGSELRVEDAIPEGTAPPDFPEEPQLTAPGVDPILLQEAAKRLFR